MKNAAARVSIIENTPADLKELIRRLVNRVPPASPAGEEARDVLLWLSVLAVGQKQEVAFITGDNKAFFHDGSLKSELKEDIKLLKSKTSVYEGLDNFLKAHHRRTDSWVDKPWIIQQIESSQTEDALEEFITGRAERLLPRVDGHVSLTGYTKLIQIVQSEVEDFFVSDITTESLFVGVTLWAELEIEVEYEPYDWRDIIGEQTSKIKTVYPTLRAELAFEVTGRKLKSVSVTDMERD